MSQRYDNRVENGPDQTTVEVRCTGHVRETVGKSDFQFQFEGSTLREFLDAFLEEYDVKDELIATDEESESAPGWAPTPEELPGTWKKNEAGERVRRFARVLVNGRFNEHIDGFDTELEDGDRVSLMYPFVFCV
ncbi:MAG: MoaD/ThiS family protein [Halodesulfurarchaeum sp.]